MKKALSVVIAIAFSSGLLYSALNVSALFNILLSWILIGAMVSYWAGAWKEMHFFWKSVLVAGSIAAILSLSDDSTFVSPFETLFVGFILGAMWYDRYSKDQRENELREKAERHSKGRNKDGHD